MSPMTIDQLNKLTDEEVRVLCSERMGWELQHDPETSCSPECWDVINPDGYPSADLYARKEDAISKLPNYPADLNAAFTLVEKLRSEGWECFIETNGDQWRCDLLYLRPGNSRNIRMEDPSLARAICLSFLAVTEREEG